MSLGTTHEAALRKRLPSPLKKRCFLSAAQTGPHPCLARPLNTTRQTAAHAVRALFPVILREAKRSRRITSVYPAQQAPAENCAEQNGRGGGKQGRESEQEAYGLGDALHDGESQAY